MKEKEIPGMLGASEKDELSLTEMGKTVGGTDFGTEN